MGLETGSFPRRFGYPPTPSIRTVRRRGMTILRLIKTVLKATFPSQTQAAVVFNRGAGGEALLGDTATRSVAAIDPDYAG